MSHPFGDLLAQYLHRKHGLSQNKLAVGIERDPAVVSDMVHGRRLTGPRARERVLAIILWCCDQGILEYVDEASALLEAAGMAGLNIDRPEEVEIARRLRSREPQKLQERGQDRRARLYQLNWKKSWPAFVTPVIIVPLIVVISGSLHHTLTLWRDDFNPIKPAGWMHGQTSAVWDDVPGLSAALRENNPEADFGKVESQFITVPANADAVLQIDVTSVDPNASYTVQIRDARTGGERDVLKGITFPGQQIVDISQEMGWQQQSPHVFTINLWISGESKSITFDLVSVEAH